MKRGRPSHFKLYSYIGREYLSSFVVSFFFFFFIFFVNQILVLAQKILLKNVSVGDVLMLVVLSIPQFLMYTMPFSSLASASMVIGNFSSQNEILAFRSCGIHIKHVFRPIVVLSLILSVCTFFIADRMIPWTAMQYRKLYVQVLRKMPALELKSYSSTRFGNRVISNGQVRDNIIYDILIFDDSDKTNSRVVKASQGTISLVDEQSFTYCLSLKDASVMITDVSSSKSYSLVTAQDMKLYLSLASTAGGMGNISPSQMSVSELVAGIEEKKEEQASLENQQFLRITDSYGALANSLFKAEDGYRASDFAPNTVSLQTVKGKNMEKAKTFSFYLQYYRSELQKKIALSLACTALVFIAFPLSFIKVKNGRLIGFGLSMLVACFYWFFLYFLHLKSIEAGIHPVYFMHIPNVIAFVLGLALIIKQRKS